jgi:hypothetical protein
MGGFICCDNVFISYVIYNRIKNGKIYFC